MHPETRHISKKSLLLGTVIFILIAGLGGGSYYFYSQYRQSQEEIQLLKTNPTQAALIETRKIVGIVSKLIILPPNEVPLDITITDSEKLKDQPLFTNAKNGDRMLIYSQARKAILYRPSLNKIVDSFSNITLNNPPPTPTPASLPEIPPAAQDNNQPVSPIP